MPSDTNPVPTNVLIPERHREALKLLSAQTRISQSEYLREAIADLLDKYAEMVEDSTSEAA